MYGDRDFGMFERGVRRDAFDVDTPSAQRFRRFVCDTYIPQHLFVVVANRTGIAACSSLVSRLDNDADGSDDTAIESRDNNDDNDRSEKSGGFVSEIHTRDYIEKRENDS